MTGSVSAFQSGPEARVFSPAGSDILISILELGVCPLHACVLSYIVSGDGLTRINSVHRSLPERAFHLAA